MNANFFFLYQKLFIYPEKKSSIKKIRITSLGAFWSIIIMLKIHLDATVKVEKCVNKSSFGRVKIYASNNNNNNNLETFFHHHKFSFPITFHSLFLSSFPIKLSKFSIAKENYCEQEKNFHTHFRAESGAE